MDVRCAASTAASTAAASAAAAAAAAAAASAGAPGRQIGQCFVWGTNDSGQLGLGVGDEVNELGQGRPHLARHVT
jgi:hypothetical protein